MVRKKVDERVRTLLGNGVKRNHRSLVVLVGDAGKDQVVNLHYMLSKMQVKARPSVLWCYKKELGFSTHKKKRMRQIKKMVQRGLYDPEKDDPFELFVASTNIRWSYYKDSEKVLGQTFGMCVLQDFEALTPNLLARTIETVEGGGLVVVLLKKLDSLKQLYSMAMDVHSRFRTEAHSVVKPRFNERFLLSLGTCETCVVMDDELNILPLSKHIRHIKPLLAYDEDDDASAAGADSDLTMDKAVQDWNVARKQRKKLAALKESLAGAQPASNLVGLAKTVDQAKALLNFIEAVSDKSLASTVTLTAARGRGKSAALGVSIAAAVAFGYSNIFVTSPSPENLKTVFEFLFKGLDALEYKEHMDYEIIQSTNPEFHKAVVRVNIFHQHRQTVQYIDPRDSAKLAQAELVVIDEAAAIPLPLVKDLIGPYLVFMSSTVNGYEGTGRSLSLKLISQLRQSAARQKSAAQGGWRTNEFMYKAKEREAREEQAAADGAPSKGTDLTASASPAAPPGAVQHRTLREIELKEPIRYSDGDPVEAWLNRTLCLEATGVEQFLTRGTPHPRDCTLFAVDRDTLFSHHSVSEAMLQRIVSLFVASHYKNTPNDLQLLSDAPAHRLFVLLGPQSDDGDGNMLPDILCVVQVALEGGIARKNVEAQFRLGSRASGDLVPWTVSQQFQDNDFARLDGARIVRISTHPGATRMGYGKRALELLSSFYQGELVNADALEDANTFENLDLAASKGDDDLRHEKVKARKQLAPLMVPVTDLRAPRLHYMSVSYGLTDSLFNFWADSSFRPVYLRQTANSLTGEYTCIMLRPLDTTDLSDGLSPHWEDRFFELLSGPFRGLTATLGLGVVNAAMKSALGPADQAAIDAGQQVAGSRAARITSKELGIILSMHDIKRLEAYAKNLVDFHMVADLLPKIAKLFFRGRLPESLSLSVLQRALLVAMGLQCKNVDDISREYDLAVSQLLALFNKAMRKIVSTLKKIQQEQVEKELDETAEMKQARDVQKKIRSNNVMTPLNSSMDAEQASAGKQVLQEMNKRQTELLESLDLSEYAVRGDDSTWSEAVKDGVGKSGVVAVRSATKSDQGGHSSGNKKKSRKSQGSRAPATPTDPREHKRAQEDRFSGRKRSHKRSKK